MRRPCTAWSPGFRLTAVTPPHLCSYVALGYVFGWCASILFGGHYRAVLDSTKPKLFIQGDKDEFTSASQLREVCSFAHLFSLHALRSHDTKPAHTPRVCSGWCLRARAR